jgi:hypothetical protein
MSFISPLSDAVNYSFYSSNRLKRRLLLLRMVRCNPKFRWWKEMLKLNIEREIVVAVAVSVGSNDQRIDKIFTIWDGSP